MAENRDFLAESNQLRSERLSRTCLAELKAIRKENEVLKKQNLEFFEKNWKLEQKLSKLENKILGQMQIDLQTPPKIPIRQAVLGTWKWTDSENFENSKQVFFWNAEQFLKNLKFELVDGWQLKHSGAGHNDREEEEEDKTKILFVEGNRLKSIWSGGAYQEEYFIENGRLHYVENWGGVVWKRIYKKL